MKEGWEYKKLGEVCETCSGGTPSKSHPEYYERGTIPWLRSGEISQGLIYKTELFITEEGLNKSSAKMIPVDTVSIAMYGATIGQVGIIKTPMCTNQAICNILPNDTIFPLFLKLFLQSKKEKFVSLGAGGAQPNISQNIIRDTLIPLPPLTEQQSIVAELDKINEIIDLKKAQLKDLDLLAQSIFYDMFGDPIENSKGWEVKKLGEVCAISSSKRVLIQDVVEEGIPFLRGTELMALGRAGHFDDVKFELFITQEHYERVKGITGVPKKGDLLIPSINSDGVVWINDTDKPFYFKDGRVLWVHLNENAYIGEYLHFSLHKHIQDVYSELAGATFLELKLITLRELKMEVPPLSLQQSFASKIQAIESQKSAIKQSLAEVETLLASRMDYWFGQ